MPNLGGDNGKDSVASRKLAAAEQRRARKAARESPRSRLLSDSSDELPKSILKNSNRTSMIPTKRSVSECVDDLSQIMDQLDLNIHDFPKANRKFCPHHQYFNEEEEDDDDEEDEDNDDDDDDDDDNDDDDYEEDDGEEDEEDEEEAELEGNHDTGHDDEKGAQEGGNKKHDKQQQLNKKCDCNSSDVKPKKSVRFDERVYETVFFASKLYDRRYFAKYHFSSRHHPNNNNSNNHSNKKKNRSKSESKDEVNASNLYGKLTKSQRAKQSKKDKKKKREMSKRENHSEGTDTSSNDDQGYCSSFHSFSD